MLLRLGDGYIQGPYSFLELCCPMKTGGRRPSSLRLSGPVVITTAASCVPLAVQVRHSFTSDGPEDDIIASRHVYELTLCVRRCVHQCTEQPGSDLGQLTCKQTVLMALGAQKEVNWEEKGF